MYPPLSKKWGDMSPDPPRFTSLILPLIYMQTNCINPLMSHQSITQMAYTRALTTTTRCRSAIVFVKSRTRLDRDCLNPCRSDTSSLVG